jgi:uncharacterized SAM-binding protein YcdF (DUF218 family)
MEPAYRLIELAVTPPGVIVVLLVVSFFAYTRSYWLGTTLLALTTVLLVIVSLPLTAHMLMNGLQAFAKPLDLEAVENGARATQAAKDAKPPRETPQAIVVLGAGRYAEAPEYAGRDTVSTHGLVRLRYAAALHRASGLPILVSGGAPDGEATAEAGLMRDALVNEFRVNVKWVEGQSRNTNENARYSAAQLAPAGIGHVYLVTHAAHMRRAARAFERAGIRVTPAPTGFHTLSRKARELAAYLPSSEGLNQTRIAVHERLGFWWFDTSDDAKPAGGGTSPAVTPAPPPAR